MNQEQLKLVSTVNKIKMYSSITELSFATVAKMVDELKKEYPYLTDSDFFIMPELDTYYNGGMMEYADAYVRLVYYINRE